MCLKEWQVPPKWLLVEDSDDLFCLWWENHHYQETQDQNTATLSTSLDSLVREKVALEEHIHALELCEGVMQELVDSLVRMHSLIAWTPFSTWPTTLLELSWNGTQEVEGAMSLLSLRDRLDQGMSLPVVPDLPLPPSGPYPCPQPVGVNWSLPSPQSLNRVGPLQLKRQSSWATCLGQCCQPSWIWKLWNSVIQDFLGMEDLTGTWEVTRAFGEELEMHQIELDHNVLGCQECSVEGGSFILSS